MLVLLQVHLAAFLLMEFLALEFPKLTAKLLLHHMIVAQYSRRR
jgi:hypothetical protein